MPRWRRRSPPASIATRFVNEEGGIDVEQFRVESVVDRVNTTGAVFLGLTVGCCQCHDHKFDPLSQREYYQFFAFLNNADEPTLELGTPDEIKRRNAVRTRFTALDNRRKTLDSHDAGAAVEVGKQPDARGSGRNCLSRFAS